MILTKIILNKIIKIVFLVEILSSCSSHHEMENYFINGKNDYWVLYKDNSTNSHEKYYRFNDNGKSDEYCRSEDSLHICRGSDLITSDAPWKLTSDSILEWGILKLHIVSCSNNVIVLYKTGEFKKHLFLIKTFENNLINPRYYYDELNLEDNNGNVSD